MLRSTLWESIPFFQKPQEEEILDKLATCPVFSELHPRSLQIVRDRCHLRQYKENEHVFRSGEPGVGMYIILEGKVEIYRKEHDYKRQFAVLGPGDFFGEIALLENLPRTASARSMGYSRLMGFFRPDLMSLFQRKPRLASLILMNMARLTARRLVNTNQALEECQGRAHHPMLHSGDEEQLTSANPGELIPDDEPG